MTVSCGSFHTIALDTLGSVWGWLGGGDMHNYGQCGARSSEMLDKPNKLAYFEGKGVTQISAGGYHSIFLCRDNVVYGLGSGKYGENGGGEFFD